MNVRPIIIESNRELAYRELIQSEISQDATSNALLDNFPNNTWKTSIDSGLEVVPGDTIQLDSAMINSIGNYLSLIMYQTTNKIILIYLKLDFQHNTMNGT